MSNTATVHGRSFPGLQVGGYRSYASVGVVCRPAHEQTELVEFSPWMRLHDEWKAAIILGAELALIIANDFRRCSIGFMNSNGVDPTPFSRFLATMKAVWDAVGYTPPTCFHEAVHNVMEWIHDNRNHFI